MAKTYEVINVITGVIIAQGSKKWCKGFVEGFLSSLHPQIKELVESKIKIQPEAKSYLDPG